MSDAELPWSIRAGLSLLPRSYRKHRAAELRATFGEVADQRGLSVGAEALSLVALSIRVRGRSLIAPPSHARARAAALAAVVLPALLLVPAAHAIDLVRHPIDWRFSALVPAWIAAVLVGVLTLAGAGRWAHRCSTLAVVLFIGGLLALVATANLDAAVRESGWLPLLVTSAALNRNPQRVRDGRRLLDTGGLAIVAVVAISAATAYLTSGPFGPFSLPAPLDAVLFYDGRLVIGGALIAACLVGLVSRTARAVVPVAAMLGMFYVGAALEANLWPGSELRYALIMHPVGHLILQMVVIPIIVFVAARGLTALVDRVGRTSGAASLAG